MRSRGVLVIDELFDNQLEKTLAADQQRVEALFT
jgi:hypothetical protein